MTPKNHFCHQHHVSFINPDGGPKWWHPLADGYCFESDSEPVAQPDPPVIVQTIEEPCSASMSKENVEVAYHQVIQPEESQPTIALASTKRTGHYCVKHRTKFSKMPGWSQFKHSISGTALWCVEQEDGSGIVEGYTQNDLGKAAYTQTCIEPSQRKQIADYMEARDKEPSSKPIVAEYTGTLADLYIERANMPVKQNKTNWKLLVPLLLALSVFLGVIVAVVLNANHI